MRRKVEDKMKKEERLQKELDELRKKIERDRNALLNVIEDLRESEGKYRVLIEASSDGVISIDEDGKIIFADKTAQEMFGYKEEELIGKHVSILMPPEYIEKHEKAFKNFLNKPRKLRRIIEVEGLKKNGERFPVEFSISAYKKDDSYTFIAIGRDVSERKKMEEKLRESEEKYRLIFEEIPDGILVFDANGNIIDANQIVCRTLGYKKEELIGKNIKDFVLKSYLPQLERRIKLLFKGKTLTKPSIYEIKDKQGNKHVVEVRTSPISKDGKIIAFQSAIRDITEKIETEAFLERMMQTTPAGILVYQDDYFVYANKAAEKITGYTEEELLNMHFWDFIPEDYRDEIIKTGKERQRGRGKARMRELPFYTKGGEIKWGIFSTSTIKFRGRPAGLVTFIDITQRKEAEEALKESEEKYRNLFESSPEGIAIISLDGTILDCNPSVCKIAGIDIKEAVGKKFGEIDIVEKKEMEKLEKLFRRKIKGEDFGIKEIKLKNGKWIETFSTFLYKENKPYAIQLILRDITDRKKMEEALRESEARFRGLVENAQDGIYIITPKGFEYVNPAFEKITGYKREEIYDPGFSFWKLIHKGDIPLIKEREKAREKGKELLPMYSFRIVRKDGGIRWVEVTTVNIGRPGEVRVIGILRDITERKEIEEALKESEEKFRALAESSPAAIFIIQDNVFKYVNPSFEKITGYSKKDLSKMKFWELVHPEEMNMVRERGEKRQKGEKVEPYRYEFRIITKDGKIRWVELAASTILYKGRPAILGNAYEITERKKAEEEISKLSRLHYAIGKSINESDTIKQLAKKLLKEIKNVMGFDYVSIFIYNKKEGLLKPIVFYGYPKDFKNKTMHAYIVDKSQPWEAVKVAIERKTRYIQDVRKYKPLSFNWELYKKYDAKELYTVPLITKNELYGVLQILNTSKNPLKESDKKLLKIIAEEIAAGIAKIKAQEEMRHALEEEKKFKADTAHYFFNPIAIAKGYLEIAKEDGGDKEKIEKALHAIERVEKVVKNIVTKGEIHE